MAHYNVMLLHVIKFDEKDEMALRGGGVSCLTNLVNTFELLG